MTTMVSLSRESDRQRTFASWKSLPSDSVTPQGLAAAGFFHNPTSSSPDRCTCFVCGISLVQWQCDDDPLAEHVKNAPRCPFVRVASKSGGSASAARGMAPSQSAASSYMRDAHSAGLARKWTSRGVGGQVPSHSSGSFAFHDPLSTLVQDLQSGTQPLPPMLRSSRNTTPGATYYNPNAAADPRRAAPLLSPSAASPPELPQAGDSPGDELAAAAPFSSAGVAFYNCLFAPLVLKREDAGWSCDNIEVS
ncbi:Protein bir1 [Diplonema papillatum]|nr:Protein bir1 [Diplonema papillatum]